MGIYFKYFQNVFQLQYAYRFYAYKEECIYKVIENELDEKRQLKKEQVKRNIKPMLKIVKGFLI